jgi:hypothetical protein
MQSRRFVGMEVTMIAILVVAAVIVAGLASGVPTSPDDSACNEAIAACKTDRGAS